MRTLSKKILFTGPQSDVLHHVPLTIVERGNCTKNQICSFGGAFGEKDTCQSGEKVSQTGTVLKKIIFFFLNFNLSLS